VRKISIRKNKFIFNDIISISIISIIIISIISIIIIIIIFNNLEYTQRQPTFFSVLHYAEPVTYNIEGFLEKNRNNRNIALDQVMATSKLSIGQLLFCMLMFLAFNFNLLFVIYFSYYLGNRRKE
jgi:hypothetical protein